MNGKINWHLCLTCIWNDQCEDEQSCAFYDDGRNDVDMSDDEIIQLVENGREKYRKEYWNYLKEYGDGRYYE